MIRRDASQDSCRDAVETIRRPQGAGSGVELGGGREKSGRGVWEREADKGGAARGGHLAGLQSRPHAAGCAVLAPHSL